MPAAPRPADVVAVARHGAAVEIDPAALAGVRRARAGVEALAAADRPIYGVSTGFGALASTRISPPDRARVQAALVRSHAAGTGAEVEREVVRATMLLRLHTMLTGHTGIRPTTAEAYAAALNAGITPVIREYGSLGCSGDLAPLATCALAITGEGEVRDAAGTLLPAARGAGRRRDHARSCSPRRRASHSSTAPMACSGCSCSRWPISPNWPGWPTCPPR